MNLISRIQKICEIHENLVAWKNPVYSIHNDKEKLVLMNCNCKNFKEQNFDVIGLSIPLGGSWKTQFSSNQHREAPTKGLYYTSMQKRHL